MHVEHGLYVVETLSLYYHCNRPPYASDYMHSLHNRLRQDHHTARMQAAVHIVHLSCFATERVADKQGCCSWALDCFCLHCDDASIFGVAVMHSLWVNHGHRAVHP